MMELGLPSFPFCFARFVQIVAGAKEQTRFEDWDDCVTIAGEGAGAMAVRGTSNPSTTVTSYALTHLCSSRAISFFNAPLTRCRAR